MTRLFALNKNKYLCYLIAQKHTLFYDTFAADLTCLLNFNKAGMLYDNSTIHNLPCTGLLGEKLRQFLIEKNKIYTKIKIQTLFIKHYDI
jgi:hypothetical protein